jgi:hypothetical protein
MRSAMLLATLTLAAAACSHTTEPIKPGPPARIDITAGDAQSAIAGTALTQALSVTVRDSKGMAVPNATVTFAVTAGGGSLTPSSAISDANGLAGGVMWTLGTLGGDQIATAKVDAFVKQFTATVQSSFPVTLRFFGPTMSPDAQAAFTYAANRLRAAITLPASLAQLPNTYLKDCGITDTTALKNQPVNEQTTGLIIYASVAPIDGPGKIIAQAGPCYYRPSSSIPIMGTMEFDAADIQNYINTGRFNSVVLHEMNHVFGFGTMWTVKGLLKNPAYDSLDAPTGSQNPRFVGATAIAQCMAHGGNANLCSVSAGVAVEQCGEVGTADGHWREIFTTDCSGAGKGPVGGTLAFDSELMTGWVEATANMPWSTTTIGSFQDLGYTVNLLAADAFTMPSLLARARASLQEASGAEGSGEVLRRPRFTLTPDGRRQRVNPWRK